MTDTPTPGTVAALRKALLETAREVHAYGLISRHGYSEPFETCEDVYCADARALASPAPSPARDPLDVERLSTAILNTLYPNWPKKGGYPHEPWHDDAVQIAAEYARLSDNP